MAVVVTGGAVGYVAHHGDGGAAGDGVEPLQVFDEKKGTDQSNQEKLAVALALALALALLLAALLVLVLMLMRELEPHDGDGDDDEEGKKEE